MDFCSQNGNQSKPLFLKGSVSSASPLIKTPFVSLRNSLSLPRTPEGSGRGEGVGQEANL